MDEAQRGEALCVVPSEEGVDALVGVEPQTLAYDLDGEDFRVGEFRGGAALAQGFPVFEPVVDEAEDGNDEGVKIHGIPPYVRRCPIGTQRTAEVWPATPILLRATTR